MTSPLEHELHAQLRQLRGSHRWRECPPVTGASRRDVVLDGQPLTSFCSNDYLGLATHPDIKAAASAACEELGAGAGASRLVSGNHIYLRALEQSLEGFLDSPALVFPTGYQANLGVLTALAGPGDLVLSDALNHASLIDGCRLCRAQVAVYKHADVADVAIQLARAKQHTLQGFRRIFVVSESVFSMDGDLAPLSDLAALCQAENANLIVDEAHAIGGLGPGGRGLCAAMGVSPAVLVGTLGKAFGAGGGFVATSPIIRDYLINRARTFIFTTALPPPVAAAALAAVALVSTSFGESLRMQLLQRIRQLQQELGLSLPETPILPVILGSDARALAASAALRSQGLFVQAIRPPTVPEGTARLRITLSAAHTPAQVAQLGAALRPIISDIV